MVPRIAEKRRQVFLHIGAMKTGTTYLQNLMAANKPTLAAEQVLFPGRTWMDQDWAVRDILGLVNDPTVAARSEGMWRKLTTETLESDTPTCGQRMPLSTTPLPPDQQRCVHAWVEAVVKASKK